VGIGYKYEDLVGQLVDGMGWVAGRMLVVGVLVTLTG
jgi:hypothetical protein